MITMLGLFIVVTYVEQRLIVLPNTAGKKELYGSNPCYHIPMIIYILYYLVFKLVSSFERDSS